MPVTPRHGCDRIRAGARVLRRLHADRCGTIALMVALIFPVLIGLGLLSLDSANIYYRKLLLRQTVQAAALAGGNKLWSYFTSNQSDDTIVQAAQTLATSNMPTAAYGTVVPAANVVLGNWNADARTFTSLAASGGTIPDAVKVTAVNSQANGNPLNLILGGLYGYAQVDISVSAIASYGTGKPFHTILVNDLSQSFSSSIANQRAADKAILDCIRNSTSQTSKVGLIGFTGHYGVIQAPIAAYANYDTLKTRINSLKSCGNTGMPQCSGSNVAAGIYKAAVLFSTEEFASTLRNIVIITDGVPNADSITYGREDGIYPTPTSTTPTCTNRCTDAKLLTMAQNQAAYARSLGISISTIYYTGNTPKNQQASYAASLATLVGGTGIALTVPSTSQISTSFAAFCATMSSKLMAVM